MTGGKTIIECVELLSTARVVCIGDVMLDRFVYGEVERISPEAPVPVCRVTSETAMLGGAGNVIRNLVALGAQADFIAMVGDDEPGGDIARLLQELDGVEVALLRDPARHTTIKTRYFAGAQQLLRADQESVEAVSDALADELFAAAEAAFAGAGVLVLSDYGKGTLTDALTARLIAAAKAAGLAVIVDPKGDDYTAYRGATLVTPNRLELARATGLPTGTDEEAAAAARRCVDECGLDAILVTRGADGMTLVGAGGAAPLHLASDAREVFDVSGAGDTVVAALAAALAAGIELADSVNLANLAAGIVVGKIGTAVAYGADVLDAARREDLFG
ncbi:MAG: D-glycero-beta-D-manno-heptose-7-phosphate kinase, partial [Alphaproteobacteria bacterium]